MVLVRGVHMETLVLQKEVASDYFPASVSLNSDGTVVAGGSISYDTQVGYTRVFKYSTDASGNWINYGPDIHPEEDTTYSYSSRLYHYPTTEKHFSLLTSPILIVIV